MHNIGQWSRTVAQENVNSGGSTDDLCVDNGPNRGSTGIRFVISSDFHHDILMFSYDHIVENKKTKYLLSHVVLNVLHRNGPNVATGDCVCWDRGFDYRGADLPIGEK